MAIGDIDKIVQRMPNHFENLCQSKK